LFILHPSSFPLHPSSLSFRRAASDGRQTGHFHLRHERSSLGPPLVGKVLFSMGYEPVWQDIANTDGGELLDVLRRRIAPAAVVVQLVGRRYGAEPLRKQSLRLHRNLVLLGIAALVGVVTVGILIFIKFNGDSRPRFISAFCQAGEPFKVRS
jgi:hypothetical protein